MKRFLGIGIHKLLSIVGNDNYKRFIILSRSRTGSNLLVSLLNSHPNIYTEGEIFASLKGRDYRDILASAFSKRPFYKKAKGFKMFYYHPMDDWSCGIWNELQSMKDLHVIHLKRRNILNTLFSRKIAGINDKWQTTGKTKCSSCCFTVDELKSGFEETRRWEKCGDNDFKNHPRLSIYYEDLVDDRASVFSKITDFLGVKYIEAVTNLKKQNPGKIRDKIKNYDELKPVFSQTEWAPLFED